MSWKFDLNHKPKPIVLRDDGQEITLHHEFLTAREKLAVQEVLAGIIIGISVDAAVGGGRGGSIGLEALTDILWPKIVRWEGVVDGSGNPIPLKTADPDGTLRSNLNSVMGLAPVEVMLLAIFFQIAANGIRIKSQIIDIVTATTEGEVFAKQLREGIADFLSPPSAAAGECSTSSAATETSTPTSA